MEKKEKPRRIRYIPHPDKRKAEQGEKVKALSLDFDIKEEQWNIYELEDGTRIKIRATVSRFERSLDPLTEKPMYNDNGEPLYGLSIGVETSFEYGEKTLRDEAEAE